MGKKSNDSVTVAFRLTVDEHRILCAQAEMRRQTAGTYARHIVLDALQNRDGAASTEELRRSLTMLKQKLGLFATVLLTNSLPLPSHAVAEWVKTTWFDEDQPHEIVTPSHSKEGTDNGKSAASSTEGTC